MTCSTTFFRQFPIFRDLADEELREVHYIANQRDIKKGNVIFNEGERRDAVYFVVSGLVKVYKVSESGQEQVINLIRSNDMFPLKIASKDVVHGFEIARTTVNMMATPGNVNSTTYTFDETGEYLILCNEYCKMGASEFNKPPKKPVVINHDWFL